MIKAPTLVPRALYRVQLHEKFKFEDLERVLPYLADLGISDIYASPIFLAYPGSTHGYDLNDPNQINPELGGMAGLNKLSKILQNQNLGLIQDFVPNHMGISGPHNWRWIDVLENGRNSHYSHYFDIEWNPRETTLRDRVLVPLLHDFYGRVLESGDIQVTYEDGAFWINYREQKFPICSESYGRILERLSWQYEAGSDTCAQLETLSRQFKALAKNGKMEGRDEYARRVGQRNGLREEFARLTLEKNLQAGLNRVFKNINGTVKQPASFDALHEILEEQHYRLAYWKIGTHEINYRRFFAIDTLVGLKMESEDVFRDCHELLDHLLKERIISGVRLDHIDGLWDPAQYLERLYLLTDGEQRSPYLIVEKILTSGECLPEDWPVHGTTGYEFGGDLINVLISEESESDFSKIYARFTEIRLSPDDLVYQLKQYVIEELFPNALDDLSANLAAWIKSDRYWRDFAVNELRDALKNILSCLPVYRTYRRIGKPLHERELYFLNQAVAQVLQRNTTQDSTPYEFIRSVWTRQYPGEQSQSEEQLWTDRWIAKLQQITGAVMAKSVEDTFFYRYVRLLAANEVGHDPREFGRDISSFHESNATRQKRLPHCLLTTSTHDTKMSEDTRARLIALSEMPDEWEFMLQQWRHLNEAHKTLVSGTLAPDANEEYLLYQAMLGIWPLEEFLPSEGFRQRLQDYFHKAISEAKLNTNWNYPDKQWEQACFFFLENILDPKKSDEFLKSFHTFSEKIAERGMLNSLAQVTLKLTCPGVPDIYQGSEVWDFSLVDPDNRRPVDFELRQRLFRQLDQATPAELFFSWKNGLIKMLLTHKLLQLRKKEARIFAEGRYTPLTVSGVFSKNIIAFLREHGERQILVIVPRLSAKVGHPPLGNLWQDTEIQLPDYPDSWQNVITGQQLNHHSVILPVGSVLDSLPVAVLLNSKN